MKASQLEFRLRLLIVLVLYLIGFWAPWIWISTGFALPKSTAWLALSTQLGQWPPLGVHGATLLVTWLAILCALAGALLRIWGTAYLDPSIVHAGPMQAGTVIASGPYRYVRNPLYLGSWLLGVSIAILMPPSGALVFLVFLACFYFRLILGEEAFLATRIGAPWLEYKQQVPRLWPSLRPKLPASPAHPRWLASCTAELFPLGYAGCLAVLAWSYDPRTLVRCLLICFGLSLISRALLPARPAAAQ
ncbi:MAG TPA: isoprenylcysteine carboxylmethyltransferase family protein [Acidobacteriaceae bacterium]|jgi:protein-S-isoprenylcysteine O-methyltransferase Ste14|nr:isoprenylcysteine carboxylmethyltransferase family protein [Acidobacteriaceae bacterium]